VLETPEIVPFRLTRDLVDAMGVTGVEGPFRRAAEESMRVMRDARHMLLTVLEVFLHDPLYKWALSPAKIQQLRPLSEADEAAGLSGAAAPNAAAGGGAAVGSGVAVGEEDGVAAPSSVNSGAARAMFNVRQRLAGVTAHRDTLSVEGQVNALIHEATDMERLAKMYYGQAHKATQAGSDKWEPDCGLTPLGLLVWTLVP
jgi:ataxia telangiectasia mutated family protein